jgi:hypothetical protein
MVMLKKKLQTEDGQAVDLLLDGQAVSLTDSGVFVKSVDVEPQRVQTVKQILSLLKQLPTEDPPRDLVGKTIRRINALAAIESAGILRPTNIEHSDDRPPA